MDFIVDKANSTVLVKRMFNAPLASGAAGQNLIYWMYGGHQNPGNQKPGT